MKKLSKLLFITLAFIFILSSCKKKEIEKNEESVNSYNIDEKIKVSLNSYSSILSGFKLAEDISLDSKEKSIEKIKNDEVDFTFTSLDEAIKINEENPHIKIASIGSCDNLYALSKDSFDNIKDFDGKTIYFPGINENFKEKIDDKLKTLSLFLSIESINLKSNEEVFDKSKEDGVLFILEEPYVELSKDLKVFMSIKDLYTNLLKKDDFSYINEVLLVNDENLSKDKIEKERKKINPSDMTGAYVIIKKKYKMTDQEIENSLENINFVKEKSADMKDLIKENAGILYGYDNLSDNLFYISN